MSRGGFIFARLIAADTRIAEHISALLQQAPTERPCFFRVRSALRLSAPH